MILNYFDKYVNDLAFACKSIDEEELIEAYGYAHDCCVRGASILVFGNGGSASIAEHLSADWMKGIAHDVNSRTSFPTVHSLVSNQSLITALANDYGYEHVFAKQIEYFNNPALVIAISSSGNSPNIINGLKAARAEAFPSIALVGFDGGVVVKEKLADVILHVKSCNYGLVEDAHSVIMHSIAQQLRLYLSSTPERVKL